MDKSASGDFFGVTCGLGYSIAVYGYKCGLEVRVRSQLMHPVYQETVREFAGTSETLLTVAGLRSDDIVG